MSLNVSHRIALAQTPGNSEARVFVENVAREHANESTRDEARAALDTWQSQQDLDSHPTRASIFL